MPKTLLQAMDEQTKQLDSLSLALSGLSEDLSVLHDGLIETLDDFFLVKADKLRQLNMAFQELDRTRFPDALELDGKWSDLLAGIDPPDSFSAAKGRLGEIITERRRYIDRLKALSRTTDQIAHRTEALASEVRQTAERFMDRDLRGLPTEVKIADLATNYITLRGLDLMDSLVAGTSDRAAQLESLSAKVRRTITTLERDLKKLEQSRDILDFLGTDRATWPSSSQLDDSAIYGEPSHNIERIARDSTNELIRVLERKEQLLNEAAKQAKRDSVLSRWQSWLSLGSSFLGFAEAISRLSPPTTDGSPRFVLIGDSEVPISKEAYEAGKAGIGLDLFFSLIIDGRVTSFRHTETLLRGAP